MRISLALVLTASLLCGAAHSASPDPTAPDVFLGRLAGRWHLDGKVLGKPVHYRGEGRWVLKGGWLLLSLVDTGKPPTYQADVYIGFDAKSGDYVAHWLDRFGAAGARVAATGRRDGDTLVIVFPYTEGAFRDTFNLLAGADSGTLLLESQEKDGTWSIFASYTMKRASYTMKRAPHAPRRTPAPGK